MRSIVCVVTALMALGLSSAWAHDGSGCCEHCGCRAPCRKVCRLVCKTKKVPKITYSCECEDFCVPGPSKRSKVCDCDCDRPHHHYVYTPTCAQVRTRTKLVKHETVEEKCSYKWVVETVCDACACDQQIDQSARASGELAERGRSPDSLKVGFQAPAELQLPAPPAEATSEPATSSGLAGPLRRIFTPFFGQDKN